MHVSIENSVALVIGITSLETMTRADAQAFTHSLGQTLTTLRRQDVPIVWGAIAPGGHKLIVPTDSDDTGLVDTQTLIEMGFDETNGYGLNRDLHFRFLQEFGPRRNEVIYRKTTRDTLLQAEDMMIFGPAYCQQLYAEAGVTSSAEFKHLFNSPSLADFMAGRKVDSIMVLGAIADHCCTETAISAALKGYKTAVITDHVLGWDRVTRTRADRDAACIVWQPPERPVDHAHRIQSRIDCAIREQTRSLTSDQIEQIKRIQLLNFDQVRIVKRDYSQPLRPLPPIRADGLKR